VASGFMLIPPKEDLAFFGTPDFLGVARDQKSQSNSWGGVSIMRLAGPFRL
jgi:hypothetical protein